MEPGWTLQSCIQCIFVLSCLQDFSCVSRTGWRSYFSAAWEHYSSLLWQENSWEEFIGDNFVSCRKVSAALELLYFCRLIHWRIWTTPISAEHLLTCTRHCKWLHCWDHVVKVNKVWSAIFIESCFKYSSFNLLQIMTENTNEKQSI